RPALPHSPLPTPHSPPYCQSTTPTWVNTTTLTPLYHPLPPPYPPPTPPPHPTPSLPPAAASPAPPAWPPFEPNFSPTQYAPTFSNVDLMGWSQGRSPLIYPSPPLS
ncbi:MAG: hypothetical protein VKJ64_02885, partial [Leptolyngbyaceae bacterium]|nr:hypothetical protein [Leptolyngbyaceae bacterium]